MSVSHPPVLWAQRRDKLFLTIDVQDCANPKLKFDASDEDKEKKALKFTGALADGTSVDVHLVLYGDIDTQETKVSVTGRHVLVVIPKKTEDFWPRLTKDKQPRFVSVDWSKWVDEDEGEDAPEFDMSNMGLGGMDQFNSEDEEDEDDEEDDEEETAAGASASQPKPDDAQKEAEPNGTTV